jgi:hypothetical protein
MSVVCALQRAGTDVVFDNQEEVSEAGVKASGFKVARFQGFKVKGTSATRTGRNEAG